MAVHHWTALDHPLQDLETTVAYLIVEKLSIVSKLCVLNDLSVYPDIQCKVFCCFLNVEVTFVFTSKLCIKIKYYFFCDVPDQYKHREEQPWWRSQSTRLQPGGKCSVQQNSDWSLKHWEMKKSWIKQTSFKHCAEIPVKNWQSLFLTFGNVSYQSIYQLVWWARIGC